MLIGFCIGIMATKLNMQRPNLFTKLSHSTSKIANLFIALSVGGSSTTPNTNKGCIALIL